MSDLIERMEPKQLASQLRDFADEVERGQFAAVAFAIADRNGDGGHGCCVDQNYATPELIDEMVHTLKTAMFESFEDEK